MSKNNVSQPSNQNNASAEIKQNIPIQLTDLSIFDNSYTFLRDRFAEEMKRIDQHMHQFSSDLTLCLGETSDTNYGSPPPVNVSNWDILKNSPLVVGEGEDKALRLQFDVSGYDPSEVQVKLVDDTLIITAAHEEKTEDTEVYREYNRQFKMPPGIDPESLVSSLSRDGVLTVQAPLLIPSSPQ